MKDRDLTAPSSEEESSVERPGLYVKTFGCQMNEYDSEKVRALLGSSHRSVTEPEAAEVVFVNTCSVREKGEHKLHSLLGSLRDLKSRKPELVIGVGGCVAQQEGERIIRRHAAVDFVVGTQNLSLVPSLVRAARDGLRRQVAVDYRDEWEELPEDFVQDAQEGPLVRALVAIQRGCNKRCSFCVVPTTRGPEVSRDPEEILRELRLKVRRGAREVLFLGQTVNSYGRDLSPRYPFERLIEQAAEIPDLRRIRFTSPHPAEVRPSFIELYGRIPQLCPHIHLPLQSGSDRILKLMNRNYRTKRYLEIVDSVRERVPDIAITTDIIVGFPTESEEDFEQTLEMVRRVRYGSSYSFRYSSRPNTVARTAFKASDEVPIEVAQERLARLQELQAEISQEINREKLGTEVEVLVEGPVKTISSRMRGRIPQHTLVELEWDESSGEPPPEPGRFVRAMITFASAHGMRGRVSDAVAAGRVAEMNDVGAPVVLSSEA